MRKETFTFTSCDDEGTTIHGVRWLPDDGKLEAVLQIAHGMREYIERYEDFASFLCERGFVVAGHDHIGHGESIRSEVGRPPEEMNPNETQRGIFHTKHPDETMVEDMYSCARIIHGTYPDLPYFIMGHSMGSYLLRQFLIEKSQEIPYIDGAIIMGTGTEKPSVMNAGLLLVNVLAAIRGWDYRSKFAAGMMYGDAYRRFDTTGRNPANSWLSKDIEQVEKFESDPRARYMFSLNGYRLLLSTCKFTNRKKNVKKMRMDIPVLFISGSDDPVGNMGRGVRQATALFHAVGVSDLSLKLFAGDRHEIINETDREKVYSYIYHWITKRII